ncbi:MAG: YjcQ family protein [Ruminococcus sp.]|nr:YjcQ family protein [Ruminococcus sp.]
MEIYRAIYQILSEFEKQMDNENFDWDAISPERLGVSFIRQMHVLEMLSEAKYIQGAVMQVGTDGTVIMGNNPRLTLSGLEYFYENPRMQYFRMVNSSNEKCCMKCEKPLTD